MSESIIYGVTGVASRFISIFLLPIYTRWFNPSEYGLLDLLTTTSSILIFLISLNVTSGISRSYYEAKAANQLTQLIGTGLSLYLISTTIATIIIFSGFITKLNGYQNVTWIHFIPLLLIILPQLLLDLWYILLRLERRAKSFVTIALGDVIVSALLNIVVITIFKLGIPGVLWALLISKVIWSIVGFKYLVPQIRLSWDTTYLKEILTYSVPQIPSVVAKWAQNYANRFILVAALGLFQVGVFSLAIKIASGVALVTTAFRMAWDPYALEIMNLPDSERQYARMLDYYLVGVFGICALLGAWGNLIIQFLATDSYFEAGGLIGFIAMGLLWDGSLQIIGLGILITRKTYWGIVSYGLSGLVNLMLLWITAQQWGIVSAAVTYLIGTLIAMLITLYISQNLHYVPFRYWTIISTVIASIGLSIYFYLPTQAISFSFSGSQNLIENTTLKTAIAFSIWLTLALFIINREDKLRVLKFLRSSLKTPNLL